LLRLVFSYGELTLPDSRTGNGSRVTKSLYQTAELDRRDQVTAPVPGPVSFERGNRGR